MDMRKWRRKSLDREERRTILEEAKAHQGLLMPEEEAITM
jgi:hypothetical protein